MSEKTELSDQVQTPTLSETINEIVDRYAQSISESTGAMPTPEQLIEQKDYIEKLVEDTRLEYGQNNNAKFERNMTLFLRHHLLGETQVNLGAAYDLTQQTVGGIVHITERKLRSAFKKGEHV